MDALVPASVGTTQHHDEAMRLVARSMMMLMEGGWLISRRVACRKMPCCWNSIRNSETSGHEFRE